MDADRVNPQDIRDNRGRFVNGYRHSDLPQEMRNKIHTSQSESWKKRDDYIGNIVNEAPYVYSSWRSIMFTQKGRKAGICDDWRNFRVFYNDVRQSYSKGMVFRRKDINKPFSPDNFIWCTTEEAAKMQSRTTYIEFRGEVLTLNQLADKYGQSKNALKNRYFNRDKKGYSLEEVIFGRKKKRGSRTVQDYRNCGVNMRAKASKMISSYKNKDKKNGTDICNIDIDWMIDNILSQKCVYCGDDQRIGCDRIDNSKGHTKDNVVPCCIECNTARNNNFSFDEMKIIGNAIKQVKLQRIHEC